MSSSRTIHSHRSPTVFSKAGDSARTRKSNDFSRKSNDSSHGTPSVAQNKQSIHTKTPAVVLDLCSAIRPTSSSKLKTSVNEVTEKRRITILNQNCKDMVCKECSNKFSDVNSFVTHIENQNFNSLNTRCKGIDLRKAATKATTKL